MMGVTTGNPGSAESVPFVYAWDRDANTTDTYLEPLTLYGRIATMSSARSQ